MYTPPNMNLEPEKKSLEDDFPFPGKQPNGSGWKMQVILEIDWSVPSLFSFF